MVARNTARPSGAVNGDTAWFAPKRYGFGSSLPIAWQGWAVMLAYFAALGLSAWLILPRSIFGFGAIAVGATAAFMLICVLKTRGGWRWRWGEDA